MNITTGKPVWTAEFENEIDYQFIQRVQSEVTQSCALPFALPADRKQQILLMLQDGFGRTLILHVKKDTTLLKTRIFVRAI